MDNIEFVNIPGVDIENIVNEENQNVEIPGVDIEENQNVEIPGVDNENILDENVEIPGVEIDNIMENMPETVNDIVVTIPDDSIEMQDNDEIHGNENDQNALDQDMDQRYGPRTSGYDLRPRRPRDYGHIHTVLEHTAFTQHSVTKGLKLFGEAGAQAVMKELQQLHDRKVIKPKHAKELSKHEKHDALKYLMFLKQKRTGQIKGRGCADGRKQRSFLSKEDTSSPTVSIESVMLTSTIEAQEQRDVATVDIPGAFMQADMDDLVYMKIEGTMAELLCQIDEDYKNYLVEENGKMVLYLQLMKALYGTLKAALLFWKRLTDVLTSWGFKINPYDHCVANKVINGLQCTIVWHVDDLKISHADPNVVTNIIDQLSSEFGKEAPLTVTRGKKHDYLGMTLDYSVPGKVKIIMSDYIKGILDEAPTEMNGESPTPAANHLFEVNTDNPIPLGSEKAELFHHIVAQLLFLCKRSRPDIQTAVSFLCTRVKSPDTDDFKKLARVIKYLRKTVDMPLTLEANDTRVIKWWVDASYAVHEDMRSHTGGVVSIGKGAPYATSTRQKLNTKSSTEAELVGVSDVMSQIMWTRYFLEEQGYGANEVIVYQDNKSAILLEKNGRTSSSKRTRHINIRYFFVTDKIQRGEIAVKHCATQEMIADYFTKPLQGSQFIKLRNFIMNIDSTIVNDAENHRSVLEIVPGMNGVNEPEEWKCVMSKRQRQQQRNARFECQGCQRKECQGCQLKDTKGKKKESNE